MPGEGERSFLQSTGPSPDTTGVKKDPATLEDLRWLIEQKIEEQGDDRRWPSDALKEAGIAEASVKDLKLRYVERMAKEKNFENIFSLWDSGVADPENEEIISQGVFGVGGKISYLKMVRGAAYGRVPQAAFILFIKEHDRLSGRSSPELERYIDTSTKILNEPSPEIIRIQYKLVQQVLQAENPERAYETITEIFVHNNLPLVAKVQKVFDALYPDSVIASALEDYSSPVLRHASPRRRRQIIHNDLLKVHIESNNRSLREFLLTLIESDNLLAKLDSGADLAPDEESSLVHALRKIKTLADTSIRGQRVGSSSADGSSASMLYEDLRTQLGVAEGQTVSARVVEMFGSPLGFNSVSEILNAMEASQQQAQRRAIELVSTGQPVLAAGDVLKAVHSEDLDNIMQAGVVSREYIGAEAGSDNTPFDTDVEKLDSSSTSFEESYGQSQVASRSHYGNVVCIVKNRGQFQKVGSDQTRSGYELFPIDVGEGKWHYGIRTGFASSEIDFLILRDPTDLKGLEDSCGASARNDRYIPIFDPRGNLLFTPEMFEERRGLPNANQ